MITIYVHKTQARAELDAPVTSGSVGREVQFQFSDDWNGLVKTAVFETNNYKETATVPVSGTLAIPEDVLAYPGFQLRIGVIGKTAGDATVIPTVYADCSMIKPGASTVPVGTPPTPSQAEQLQAQINDLENRVDDLESGGGGSGGTPNAVQYVPQTLTNEQKSQARNNIGAMAADAPVVKSVNGNTPDANGNVTVEAGGTGAVELDTTLTQSGKAADAKAVGDALANVGGVSTTEKTLLLSLFKNAAYTADMSATIAQLETLWSGGEEPDEPVTPDATLSSISATYSGGSVPVGTAASSLTGVKVTAHYSDGSTATVTGYTLSGTIVEGSNTITVSYGGKTTTFTVTGVADESGGDEPGGDTEVSGDEYVVVTGATATDDGNGNVTVTGLTATDDGNGNITVS